MTLQFEGHHKTRLTARPGRFFIASAILILSIACFLAAALVPAGIHRQAAWHYAEARI